MCCDFNWAPPNGDFNSIPKLTISIKLKHCSKLFKNCLLRKVEKDFGGIILNETLIFEKDSAFAVMNFLCHSSISIDQIKRDLSIKDFDNYACFVMFENALVLYDLLYEPGTKLSRYSTFAEFVSDV